MKRSPTKMLCRAGIVAALYVVLTWPLGALAFGSIGFQIRPAEALTMLPFFYVESIPALYVGCLLANILTGCVALDILMGPIATLIGALGTYFLRRHPIPALLPPILSNAVIVPLVLRFGYGMGDAMWYMVLTVGVGEVISVGILGSLLRAALLRQGRLAV